LKKLICILLMLLSLNGCYFTWLVIDDAHSKKHYTIDKILSATEDAEGTLHLCLLGRIDANQEQIKYAVSLPKDQIVKYGVPYTDESTHKTDPYLSVDGRRRIADQYATRYLIREAAIGKHCLVHDDQSLTPLKILNLGSEHCNNKLDNGIDFLLPVQTEAGKTSVFSLPCCEKSCLQVIVAPPQKGVYPLELTGGEVNALTNPAALLYLPVAVIGDILTAPIKLHIYLLIKSGQL